MWNKLDPKKANPIVHSATVKSKSLPPSKLNAYRSLDADATSFLVTWNPSLGSLFHHQITTSVKKYNAS